MHVYLAALFVFAPTDATRVHPLTRQLRSYPDVESVVEYPGRDGAAVIIHLRDWHYVDFESFTADLRDLDPEISDRSLQRAYHDHLRDVQAVQAGQRRVIRQMSAAGVSTVFLEGLTPDIESVFPLICRTVCTDREVPLKQLQTLPNPLAMRSAGQLVAAGEPLRIRAADSEKTLAECNPIDESGAFREVSANARQRREDHIVRCAAESRDAPVLILLGGGHDLSDNMSRPGGDKATLVVVTTRQYSAASQ